MKKFLFFLLSSVSLFIACKKEIPASKKRAMQQAEIRELYHGKYKLVSSYSSVPLDINSDGKASDNLMAEIPELQFDSWVEIRIPASTYLFKNGNGLFDWFWPEQYLYEIDNEKVSVNYASQSSPRNCDILKNNKEIILFEYEGNKDKPAYRWPLPDKVTIESTTFIKVVCTRSFYTKDGWQTAETISLYEKFSNVN